MFLHLPLEKIAHHSVYTIGHAINPPRFTRKFKEESGSVSWFRILDQTIQVNHEFPKALKTLPNIAHVFWRQQEF